MGFNSGFKGLRGQYCTGQVLPHHTILLTVNKEVEKRVLAYFKMLTKNIYVGTKEESL